MGRRSRYVPPEQVSELTPHEAFDDLGPTEVLSLPPTLYCAGDVALLQGTKRVAIVGSRDVSEAGIMRASKLAHQLVGAGVVVVSGLAKGVDMAAHQAAIKAGGRTMAVIGTPLDVAYPAAHAEVQMEVYRDHLLVSQFRPGTRVFRSNFVNRNKVMARLVHASVIVEAGESSGTLSQAKHTMALGRRLFIMRSLVENPDVKWPASFVRDGATILDSTDQILGVL